MKTLRQIVELKKIDLIPDPELQAGTVSDYVHPKSEAEKNFIGKHLDTIQVQNHPAFKSQEEQDAVFKATNVKSDETHHNAGAGHYKLPTGAGEPEGEDAQIYEEALDFVRENLTEDNLAEFDQMLEENPDAAVEFAVEVASEVLNNE
tara:strand:+ start:1095 stop:1538 length:444 start_codon:yes stop_codon:yes gene_type:complete